MWVFGVKAAAQFAAAVAGAFLLAAAVAALPASGHAGSIPGYLAAWLRQMDLVAHFDFGTSQVSGLSAVTELTRGLPVTLELVGAGALVAVILGAPLGVLLGTGRRLRAAAPLVQIVAAAPVFCAGLLLLWLSKRFLGWQGAGPMPFWTPLLHGDPAVAIGFKALALPALTVGAAGAAAVQLALRRAASLAMEAPYRQGLRLMGLSGFEIDGNYLAPQILAGLLASLGEIALALLSAAAVAEWVFDWPGAAVLFVKSVALHDWSAAALVLLVFAFITIAADFAGKLAAHAIAPEEVWA